MKDCVSTGWVQLGCGCPVRGRDALAPEPSSGLGAFPEGWMRALRIREGRWQPRGSSERVRAALELGIKAGLDSKAQALSRRAADHMSVGRFAPFRGPSLRFRPPLL